MKGKYIAAIDSLRVVAILMVIIIHTTSKTIGANGNDLLGMPLTFWFNQITRGAVALFIMISGFVLEYNYNNNAIEFYKKRMGRIIVPYLFWSAIYYFFIYAPNPNNFFLILLVGGAAYQLYFIPSLLILYLLFPVIRKISKNGIILLAIGQLILLYWDYSVKSLQSWGPISVVLLNYLVFILGIMAARNQEKILNIVNKNKYYFIFISLASGIYVWLEGLGGYLSTGDYLMFYSQRRISILIYTTILAATLFYWFGKKIFEKPIFKKLSELSFFVFFVHLIFLENIWQRFEFTQRSEYGGVLFGGVTILSFALAGVIHKSKLLTKICG